MQNGKVPQLYSKMGIEMEKLIFQSYRDTINLDSNIIKILGCFFVRVLQTNSKPDDKQCLLRQKKKKSKIMQKHSQPLIRAKQSLAGSLFPHLE